jgi:hypothetical protein
MIEYRFKIESIQVIEAIDNKENIVKKIKFLLEGTRNDKIEFVIDTVELEFNPEFETFVPFEELTEETIIDWIISASDEERILQHKELIAERLGPENIVDKPLPWIEATDGPEEISVQEED